MKKILSLSIICVFFQSLQGQMNIIENVYQTSFDEAYSRFPDIPRGLLEAVSYTNTRFQHLDESIPESCTEMPRSYGVMGLIENGKNYFNENLQFIANVTGHSTEDIKSNPHLEILCYAEAYQHVLNYYNRNQASVELKIQLLDILTEIPLNLNIPGNRYAQDAFIYSVYLFMNNADMQEAYHFPNHKINPDLLFGAENFKILSSTEVLISEKEVKDKQGNVYQIKSADYSPALWNPAASCNFSSRNGTAVSAVTIHTVQGSYSGCISWFQNCNASVSAHYVLRSSDGQVTQMVLESNKAWHVGSENPYTIGLEHEGYVSNPAWYTNAMYTSSAALVSDIVNSGYGINSIRTAWWPWTAGTNYNSAGIPGSCAKIKGHQHYPNQTHTDPGINWNWNYYFKLIHPAPVATIYSTTSGTFFDSGGNSANYSNDERIIWTIAPSNATSVTVTFSNFNIENNWDYLYVYDGNDINSPLIGYYTGTSGPGTITSSGGALTFEFRSDCSTTASGWAANWNSSVSSLLSDSIAPVTLITVSNSWQTQDFDALFTDSDEQGGSGLEKAYYQVIDFDGTDWYANSQRGFFTDEFDQTSLHPQWTDSVGTWSINGGVLEQIDEGQTNSNVFANLKQDLSNRYLYQFSAMIDGSGSNRRAGFHFFSDSAHLSNRGNSYFVWFRVDQNELEFYKVVNNTINLMYSMPMTIQPGQWYDYKIIFDRISGKIIVYQDNVEVGNWTDSSPHTNGKYISFRNGNSIFKVDNFRVFRSRYANSMTNIKVGNCNSCDIRYQNISPSTYGGRIRSIVADSAGNLSSTVTLDIHVDWTPPTSVSFISDGYSSDIDSTFNGSILQGNWQASFDQNSDISRYWYAIGTSPGDSNIINWTDNWFQLSFSDSISLIPGTTYYLTVKSENGAGLQSTVLNSDGQIYLFNTASINNQDLKLNGVYPNPFTNNLQVSVAVLQSMPIDIEISDLTGKTVFKKYYGIIENGVQEIQINNLFNLNASVYLLHIYSDDKRLTIPIIKQ